jgi:hypothetical protein
MQMPFTVEQFFGVFAAYNQALWPAHLLAWALGAAAVGLALRPGPVRSRAAAGILAALWLANGLGYHLAFFTRINPAAYGFAAVFVLGAAAFAWQGVVLGRLGFAAGAGPTGLAGWGCVLYGLAGYNLLGWALGHGWPEAPMFGVAPCPTTVFTWGLLLWSRPPAGWPVLAMPALWTAVGGSAAVALAVPQDYGLIAAGALGLGVILWRRRAATARGAGTVG